MTMGTAKGPIQPRRLRNVTRKGLGEFQPTSVQKSYFMLSEAEHKVLNSALEKYRPGTRAEFSYHIMPAAISITGKGRLSVGKDLEAVLRKIEYWHQAPIITFSIMARHGRGAWHGVQWEFPWAFSTHRLSRLRSTNCATPTFPDLASASRSSA